MDFRGYGADFQGNGYGFPELRVLTSEVECGDLRGNESGFSGYVSEFRENGEHTLFLEIRFSLHPAPLKLTHSTTLNPTHTPHGTVRARFKAPKCSSE